MPAHGRGVVMGLTQLANLGELIGGVAAGTKEADR